jgi:hypothetical protein
MQGDKGRETNTVTREERRGCLNGKELMFETLAVEKFLRVQGLQVKVYLEMDWDGW